jgi:hypothetical protein
LRVSDNEVLRRIFETNGGKVIGWRKWPAEKLHNLCSSRKAHYKGDQLKVAMAGECITHGEKRNV